MTLGMIIISINAVIQAPLSHHLRYLMIYDIKQSMLEKEKKKAVTELRDYFIRKYRQENAWSVIHTVEHHLRQKKITSGEARKLTAFLAKKFDVDQPAVEHARMFSPSSVPAERRTNTSPCNMVHRQEDMFHHLFLRLQAAVQANILDYNQARSLICETLVHYPTASSALQR